MVSLISPLHTSLHLLQPWRLDPCRFSSKIRWIQRKSRGIMAKNGNFLRPEVLYDDGYGKVGVKEYLDSVIGLVEHGDNGPPRWFCPRDCGPLMKDAPLLLYLPGIDGVGLGLTLHHKALGRFFEVRCMHVPFRDRTPFEGLVRLVEDVLKFEHSRYPTKPIYLIGHSFGGCLALSVAARNPDIDLVVILSNPATSFSKSQIQPWLPILRTMPLQLSLGLTCVLSFDIGNQALMSLGSTVNGSHPVHKLAEINRNLSSLMNFSNLVKTISRNTFEWKLELLRLASNYANSRLHAVKAEVLVLVSGQDGLLPSEEEASRLSKSLSNCSIYKFPAHGHNLLLENGVNLLTIIRCTNLYRRSTKHDAVRDYLPPSMSELDIVDRATNWIRQIASPVFLSTLEDGKIVRGLDGIPEDGPVILVGNHLLLGAEVVTIIREFLTEKGVAVRGLAHPVLFPSKTGGPLPPPDFYYVVKILGGVPVSSSNFYKLLSSKSFVLLYPGGAREALHGKGEEYKLFWPDEPEFVRMACKFGATIVPFAAVGEEDMFQLLMDYDEIMSIPLLSDMIKRKSQQVRLKINGTESDKRNRELLMPVVLPKLNGRTYFLFGKPIRTDGIVADAVSDREKANGLYLHVKSEVENCISYLREKREADNCRSVLQRVAYRAAGRSDQEIPTFEL